MTDDPLVSVVTPVFNGAQYLEECITSIQRQTYANWEYVIVDNVSTDGTFEIAERLAAQDARIRVLRATEFLAIYGNSNRAMRAIDPHSRYCKVVHADDWLYPQCLQQMVTLAEDHPSVALVSAYALVGTQVWLDGVLPYDCSVVPGSQLMRGEMLRQEWLLVSPTSFLLRADRVRAQENFYDETVWHADTDAAYRVLSDSDFGFVHQVLTFARVQPEGLNQFSYRVWSFIARDGRLLIRHGPRVMGRAEYRTALRRWIARYGTWLAKQTVKPWRHRQQEFHDFHRREINYMIHEAGADRETRLALSVLRCLLRKPNGTGYSRPR